MPHPIRRRRLSDVQGFNPANYGGGTLRADFDTTKLSLADGASVLTWTDSSGNGNHATAGTAPVYKVGIQNGKPGVLFAAASSQYLAANGLASVQNGTDLPVTIVAVLKKVGNTGFQTAVGWGASGSVVPQVQFATSGANYFYQRRDDAASTVGGGLVGAPGTTLAHVTSWVYTGTAISTLQDGVSLEAVAACDNGITTVNQCSLGAILRPTAVNFWDGYLFEVLVYASALSAADRSAIERALGAKWGITVA